MKRTPSPRNRRLQRRLRFESLESRQLLAANVISGFVYNDANRNGLFDAGETPLAGSTLQLVNSQNVTVSSATSGADGAYQFSIDRTVSTAPTTLTRSFSVPGQFTPFTVGGTVPQFDPDLGTLTSVQIRNDLVLTNRIRIESLDNQPVTVTGTSSGSLVLNGPGVTDLTASTTDAVTFNASAFDGVNDFGGTSGADFGERTRNGSQSITLTDPTRLALYTGTGTVAFTEAADGASTATGAGNLVQSVSTAAGGTVTVVYTYIPNNCLRPGDYRIVQTQQPPGFVDGLESRDGVVLPGSDATDVIPVRLGVVNLPNNNFGEVLPTVPSSLSGFVYFDANNDGIKQPSEFGIATVVINLTGTDTLGQPVARTTTTAADGSYLFDNLPAGTFAVSEVQPRAFRDGKDRVGSLGGVTSNDRLSSISLPAGAGGVNYNFGELAVRGCRLLCLTLIQTRPGRGLLASQIGPLIRRYLPTLVPVITRPGLDVSPPPIPVTGTAGLVAGRTVRIPRRGQS